MTRGYMATALAVLAAGPVLADVTPGQVWDDITGYMADFGYSVTATETLSGNTLTVTDVQMSVTDLGDGGSFGFSMDEVVLQQQPGGTVAVSFPETMPIAFSFVPEPGDPALNAVVNYTHSGLQMVVSGTPDALVYDYTANQLAMELVEVGTSGVLLTREVARFSAEMGPVSGQSTVTQAGNVRDIAQQMTFGSIVYDLHFADPEGSGAFSVAGDMTGIAASGATTLPSGLDMSDPVQIFEAGLSGNGAFTHNGSRVSFSFSENGETVSGQQSSASGRLSAGFSGDAFSYLLAGTGTMFDLQVPDFPFPIAAQMGESLFELAFPMAPADGGGPREATMRLTLGDLSVSDLLWGLVDAGGVLPRDPVTLAVDLSALVTPFVNLFDVEAMEQLDRTGGMPGELNAVNLNDLRLSAVGADVSGTGAFVFDNTDLESFDGMPRPEGELNVQASGVNALIDNLIAMGIVGEQDALGARMMLSIFTVPGSAPDTLGSTITINDQGHILANGQRLQ